MYKLIYLNVGLHAYMYISITYEHKDEQKFRKFKIKVQITL